MKSHEQLDEFPQEKVRSAIRAGIAEAEDKMTKKNGRKSGVKRKMVYAISSVAAVFTLMVGSAYYSPAVASTLSQIPFIGTVFGDSDLIGLQQAHEKGLTNEVGETQTVNGISVTLDEILYDQSKITVALIIESEKMLDESYFGAGMDITINGEYPKVSSGVYGESTHSLTTRTAVQTIDVTEEMPDEFELGLILQGEQGERWYFSALINKLTDMTKIPVEASQNVDGIDLTITEVTVSETGVSVSYESIEEGADFNQSRANDIEFHMVDQDGNQITNHSGGVTGEIEGQKMVFYSNKQFDPIDAAVTELTITPYLALPSGGGKVEINGDGEAKHQDKKEDVQQQVEFRPIKVKIPQ